MKNRMFSFNVFWESVKQSKYIVIIHTLLLFFVTTFPVCIDYRKLKYQTLEMQPDKMWIENLAGFNYIVLLCAIAVVLFTVIYNFSYLFKQSSVQFYNSMPYTRSCMYLSKFAACFVVVFLPLAVILSINFGLYNTIVSAEFKEMYGFFKFAAGTCVCYLVILCICVFSASVAGNVVAMIFSAGFSALWGVATLMAICIASYEWFENMGIAPTDEAAELCMPFIILIAKTDYIFTLQWGIAAATSIIVFFALGLICYNKRKSENTTKFIVFSPLLKFFRYYVCFIASLGLGIAFEHIVENTVAAVLGYWVIFVLMYCVLNAVFEKNIREIFKNIKTSAVMGFVWMLILMPAIYGFFEPKVIAAPLCESMEIYLENHLHTITHDKEIIAKVMECTSEEGDRYLSCYISVYSPFVNLELKNRISEDAMEKLEDAVYATDEYLENREQILKDERICGQISCIGSSYRFDLERSENEEFYNILAEEIKKYDYETKKASGVFAELRPNKYTKSYTDKTLVLADDYIYIYNCYEESIAWLKQNTGCEYYFTMWDKLSISTWAEDKMSTVYETCDKEIIKKILEASGRRDDFKAQRFVIDLTAYADKDGVEYYGQGGIAVYYNALSEEVKNIINPKGLELKELAEK